MKKLIRGIIDFRKNRRPEYAQTFARLALGQKPDALFVACSDSRVVPNLFASTEPGDLFVIRNVGNIIPPCGPDGMSESDESEAAALEFAVMSLKVSDIIVCGHSECAAIRALKDDSIPQPPHFKSWLRHARGLLERAGDVDRLSQLNTLLQLDHLRSYGFIREREKAGTLGLHAWWFDIARADVQGWDPKSGEFVLIQES